MSVQDDGDESQPIPPGMRYEHGKVVPHLSADERVARARRLDARCLGRAMPGFTPATHRPDPVALLEQQAVTRVPELVPIRYGRMLVSPFTFYRGAALIMASDLASTPRSGITTQVCGDAHLMNFGVYASPERRMEFGINDFDETHPGPWEWDVKRLAASFAIAGRDNGFSTKERTKVLHGAHGPSTGPRMQRVRGHAQPRGVVLPRRRRRPACRSCSDRSIPRSGSGPRRTSPRPAPATACRRSTS